MKFLTRSFTASVLLLLSSIQSAAALTCSYPSFDNYNPILNWGNFKITDNGHQVNVGSNGGSINTEIDLTFRSKHMGQWCMLFEMKALNELDYFSVYTNIWFAIHPTSINNLIQDDGLYKNLKVLVDWDTRTMSYYQGEQIVLTYTWQVQNLSQNSVTLGLGFYEPEAYFRIINPGTVTPQTPAVPVSVAHKTPAAPEINEKTCQLNGFWQTEILSGKSPVEPKCCDLFVHKQAQIPLFCKPTNSWCAIQAYTAGTFWNMMKKSCCESFGASFQSQCSQAPAQSIGSMVPQESIHDIMSQGGSDITSPEQCMQVQQAKAAALAKALAAQKTKAAKGGIQRANFTVENFPKDVSFIDGGYCYHLHDCPSHMGRGLCNLGILWNSELFGTCDDFGYSTEVANTSEIISPKFQKFAKGPLCPSVTLVLLVI